MPLQPLLKIAVMTTTPGTRKSRYESPPVKPGMLTTLLKSDPKRTSQITGWTRVIAMNHGWRISARVWR